MTKMEAIELCAKAMLRRQGCETAGWFKYPENTELAANIVAAIEALGLLPNLRPSVERDPIALMGAAVARQQQEIGPESDA